MMKITKLFLCFVAMTTLFFAGCNKVDDSTAMYGTTWTAHDPHDEIYQANVHYTLSFGQANDFTFKRDIDYGSTTMVVVMSGTYGYSNGKGSGFMHNEGETTDVFVTFSVTDNTMRFNFNSYEVTLQKQQ